MSHLLFTVNHLISPDKPMSPAPLASLFLLVYEIEILPVTVRKESKAKQKRQDKKVCNTRLHA